eukprot:3232458-Heterocapsa_arctica.AAC.1
MVYGPTARTPTGNNKQGLRTTPHSTADARCLTLYHTPAESVHLPCSLKVSAFQSRTELAPN